MAKDDRPDSTSVVSPAGSDKEDPTTPDSNDGRLPSLLATSDTISKSSDARTIDLLSNTGKSTVLPSIPRASSITSSESNSAASNVGSSQQGASPALSYQVISNLVRSAPPPPPPLPPLPLITTVVARQRRSLKQNLRSLSSSENIQHGYRSIHTENHRGKYPRSHSSSEDSNSSGTYRHRQIRPRHTSNRKRETIPLKERHLQPSVQMNMKVDRLFPNSGVDPRPSPPVADSRTNYPSRNVFTGKEIPVTGCNFQQGLGVEQCRKTNVDCRTRINDGAHINRNAQVSGHLQRDRAYATSAEDIQFQEFPHNYERHDNGFRIQQENIAPPFHIGSNPQTLARHENRYAAYLGHQGMETRTHGQSRRDFANCTYLDNPLQQFHRLSIDQLQTTDNYLGQNARTQAHFESKRRENSRYPFGDNREMKNGNGMNDTLANRNYPVRGCENEAPSGESQKRVAKNFQMGFPPVSEIRMLNRKLTDYPNGQNRHNCNVETTTYRGQDDSSIWRRNDQLGAVCQSTIPSKVQVCNHNYKQSCHRPCISNCSYSLHQTDDRSAKIDRDRNKAGSRHLPQKVPLSGESECRYRHSPVTVQREESSRRKDTNLFYPPMFSNHSDAKYTKWSTAMCTDDEDLYVTAICQRRDQEDNSQSSPNPPNCCKPSLHEDSNRTSRNVHHSYELRETTQNTPTNSRNMVQGNTSRNKTGDRTSESSGNIESGLDSEIKEEMARARNMDIPFRFDPEPKQLNPKAKTFAPPHEELLCDRYGNPHVAVSRDGLTSYHPTFPQAIPQTNNILPGENYPLGALEHQPNVETTEHVEAQGDIQNCQESGGQVNTPNLQIPVGYQVQGNASYSIPIPQNPGLQSLTAALPSGSDGVSQMHTNSASLQPNTFVHPVLPSQPQINIGDSQPRLINVAPVAQTVEHIVGQVPLINPSYQLLNPGYINGLGMNQRTQNTIAHENSYLGQENTSLNVVGRPQPFIGHQILPSPIMPHSGTTFPLMHAQLYPNQHFTHVTPAPINQPTFLAGNQLPFLPLASATPATPTVAQNLQQQNGMGPGALNSFLNNTPGENATHEAQDCSPRPPHMNLQTFVALMDDIPPDASSALTKPISFDQKDVKEDGIAEMEGSLAKGSVEDPQIIRSVVEKFVGTVKKIEKHSQTPLTESQLVEVLCGKSISIVDEVVATYGKGNSGEVGVENGNSMYAFKPVQEEIGPNTRLDNDFTDSLKIKKQRKIGEETNSVLGIDTTCYQSESANEAGVYSERCASPITFHYMPELQAAADDGNEVSELPKETYQDGDRSDSEESGFISPSSPGANYRNSNENVNGDINEQPQDCPDPESRNC